MCFCQQRGHVKSRWDFGLIAISSYVISFRFYLKLEKLEKKTTSHFKHKLILTEYSPPNNDHLPNVSHGTMIRTSLAFRVCKLRRASRDSPLPTPRSLSLTVNNWPLAADMDNQCVIILSTWNRDEYANEQKALSVYWVLIKPDEIVFCSPFQCLE